MAQSYSYCPSTAECALALAHSGHLQKLLRRIFQPSVMCLILLVAGPAVACFFASNVADITNRVADFSVIIGPEQCAVIAVVGTTDCGQEIALFHFQDRGNRQEINTAEQDLLTSEFYEHHLIRMEGPNDDCNCHGWVFTGGQFGIQSRFIDAILTDNGYVETKEPLANDLVVYRDRLGEVTHTGIVRLAASDGLILIESKWGPMGVYLHEPEITPYSPNYSFYRSLRVGHHIRLPTPMPVNTNRKISAI